MKKSNLVLTQHAICEKILNNNIQEEHHGNIL